MTQNVMDLGAQIVWTAGGAFILFLFALTVAIPHRARTLPGSQGHRTKEEETGQHEEIHPDGYIDSFAGEIEEAGGGLPLVTRIALPGILLWWLIYLIVNWTQR
jgi:hypothetical protein